MRKVRSEPSEPCSVTRRDELLLRRTTLIEEPSRST